VDAENRGVFKNVQHADKVLLARAGWAHGQGPYPSAQIEQLERDQDVTGVLHKGNASPGLREGLREFQELTRMAKEIDPENSFHGWNKEQLRDYVNKHVGESDDC
jgi:hypothetical protein